MSIKLLRDQKEEYLEHLFEVMFEPVLKIFQDIYNTVLQNNPKNVLKQFQQELAKIPEWNQLQVEKAYQSISCDYFPKLIKTVYILTIKVILMGIPEDKRDKIKLRVPASDNFLHRCLIHMARELWKRPYLFYHLSRSIERQNNLYHCEVVLKKKIKAVIRETIPMDWVVEQIGGEEEKKSESEEEESESEGEDTEEEEESEEEEETEDTEDTEEEEETEDTEEEEETEEVDSEEDNDLPPHIIVIPTEEESPTLPSPVVEEPVALLPPVVEEPVALLPPVVEEPPVALLPPVVEEQVLQNYVIPTQETFKKVIFVEDIKKKKPKHTFF